MHNSVLYPTLYQQRLEHIKVVIPRYCWLDENKLYITFSFSYSHPYIHLECVTLLFVDAFLCKECCFSFKQHAVHQVFVFNCIQQVRAHSLSMCIVFRCKFVRYLQDTPSSGMGTKIPAESTRRCGGTLSDGIPSFQVQLLAYPYDSYLQHFQFS